MALVSKIRRAASAAVSGVRKELSVLDTLHPEVEAALRRLAKKDPGLRPFLKRARAYAVFPSVGKAALVAGAGFGMGEVLEQDKVAGYAAIVQATVGVQLGGGTFTQIIAFENDHALERFKRGPFKLTANASAVVIKAGAAAAADYEKGVAVFLHPEGGLMLETAVGGQKFIFKPAVLGRGKKVRQAGGGALASSKRRP